jgi:SPX domain protein involved in polyphosphate accumulation
VKDGIVQRSEYKYWVPDSLATEVLRMAGSFLIRDPLSDPAPEGQVNTSLYLDTPDHRFYRGHVDKWLDRIKLRIRSYGIEADKAPFAFFEVKRKINAAMIKSRATLPPEWIERVMVHGEAAPDWMNEREKPHMDQFCYLRAIHHAEPLVLIRYWRTAYISPIAVDELRLTIDRNIRFQPANGYSLATDPHAWQHVDTRREHEREGRWCVLELKFLQSAPNWMQDLVEHLVLYRTAFSKYIASVTRMRGIVPEDEAWQARAVR